METDIPTLVRESQAGDRDAFGRLYDAFAGRIYRYLYYRTFRRDLSEDLTSVTFLKALEKLSGYDERRGEFSAWLYRIAHNALMDHYRSGRKTVDLDDYPDLRGSADTAADAENRLLWDRVRPYFEKLHQTEREIVLLRVWEDLSYREIGQIVGKTEAACKMAYSRAVRSLRETAGGLAGVLAVLACIGAGCGR